MSFDRPTLATLRARTAAEIASRLGISGTLLPRGPLVVFAHTLAGHSHLHHGHLDWLALQAMPDTATGEWLERHASIQGLSRLPAEKATGYLAVTGSGTSLLPEGTRFQRGDGVQVETDADTYLVAGAATVAVTAVEAGADASSEIGVSFSIVSPVDGINSTASVADDGEGGGLTGGADQESDALLRTRLLEDIQDPPHGGNLADYIRWAKTVPGVTRVWPFSPYEGAVSVFFVRDGDGTGSAIIPDAAEIADVQAVLDVEKPATAAVTALAPTPLDLDPEIQLEPDTAAVRQAVTDSLEDLLLREATVAGTLPISHIREAISSAAGETDHVLVSPTADVVAGAGELSLLGTITWS